MKSSRVKLALLTVALTSALLGKASAADWESLPALPVPNGGFVLGTRGGKILVAGGTTWEHDVKRWLNGIWLFDPAERKWSEVGHLPFAVGYAVSAQLGDDIYFASGSSGAETHPGLYRIGADLKTVQLSRVESPRVLAAGALIGRELYVVGGTPALDRLQDATNACFSMDLQTGRQRSLPPLPLPSFATGTAAAGGGSLYVFAGARWDAATNSVENVSTAFRYAPAEGRWSELPHYPYPARGITAVALDDRRIYVGGGYKNDAEEFTREAFIFDVKANAFTPAKPFPIAAMVHLVVCGDDLYCLGGEDRKRHRTDAVFRIRLADLLMEK